MQQTELIRRSSAPSTHQEVTHGEQASRLENPFSGIVEIRVVPGDNTGETA